MANQDKDKLIAKLRFEIRKRDVVIRNLRDSKDNLRCVAHKLVEVINKSAEEHLDLRAGEDNGEEN